MLDSIQTSFICKNISWYAFSSSPESLWQGPRTNFFHISFFSLLPIVPVVSAKILVSFIAVYSVFSLYANYSLPHYFCFTSPICKLYTLVILSPSWYLELTKSLSFQCNHNFPSTYVSNTAILLHTCMFLAFVKHIHPVLCPSWSLFFFECVERKGFRIDLIYKFSAPFSKR